MFVEQLVLGREPRKHGCKIRLFAEKTRKLNVRLFVYFFGCLIKDKGSWVRGTDPSDKCSPTHNSVGLGLNIYV